MLILLTNHAVFVCLFDYTIPRSNYNSNGITHPLPACLLAVDAPHPLVQYPHPS